MGEVSLSEDEDVLEMLEERRREEELMQEASRREADVRAAIRAKDIDTLEVSLAAMSKLTVSKQKAMFMEDARRTLAELYLDRAVAFGCVEKIEDAILRAEGCEFTLASLKIAIGGAARRAVSAEDPDMLEGVNVAARILKVSNVDIARARDTLFRVSLRSALETSNSVKLEKAMREALAHGVATATVGAYVMEAVNRAESAGQSGMLELILEVAVKFSILDAGTVAQVQQTLAELVLRDALDTGLAEEIENAGQIAVARGATCTSVLAVVLEAVKRAALTGNVDLLDGFLAAAVWWGATDADVADAQRKLAELRLRDALDAGNGERIQEAMREATAHGTTKSSIRDIVTDAVNRAVFAENIESLEAVLAVAVTLSKIITRDIAQARRTLAELRLFDALDSGDAERVDKAIIAAFACGASNVSIEAAQHRLEELGKCRSGAQAPPAVDQFSAALAVGRSQRHDLLAQLLAKALLQNAHTEISNLLCKMQTDGLFSSRYSRVYSLGSGNYGMRGGKPYYKPSGWLRYAICHNNFEQAYRDWSVAYHGTSSGRTASILHLGLQRPGDAGVAVAHGQARSKTQRTIYLSPSIEYAAFPCYSQFFQLGDQHWAQLVLQCRVRPGSFREERGTLGNKHWPEDVPIDEHFPTLANLEWLLENSGDVVVYGLFVREFGPSIDSSVYGQLAHQVSGKGSKGPEFEWTELRCKHLRRQLLAPSAKRARHV